MGLSALCFRIWFRDWGSTWEGHTSQRHPAASLLNAVLKLPVYHLGTVVVPFSFFFFLVGGGGGGSPYQKLNSRKKGTLILEVTGEASH